MRKIDITHICSALIKRSHLRFTLFALSVATLLTSCDQFEALKLALAGPLTLSSTATTLALNQKQASQTGFTLSWTTGSNNGSGASISYKLLIDKKGNNFSKALSYDMGKGVYSKDFNVAAFNDSLLNRWKATAGTAIDMEAKVVSTIYSTPESSETSNVLTITVTPYQPVSKTLYIIGDASPKGWDANNALALTPSATDPTVFVYQGSLSTGSFKFITTSGQFLPSYNMGSDASHIVYRQQDSDPDNKFTITESAVYKVTVSLLDLTITIAKVDLPAYSAIYMVGSAAPNGWDISNATQLTQDTDNPYIFTYKGVMNAGDFKFPVNRNSDWGQDMYMRTDDTHMYLHHGGASDDNKWTITKRGYYTITLNLLTNTISINRLQLFMVGSATPIGWDISNAVALTEDATDGCVFVYSGPMAAGEFKLPVNRNTDWGQDMYMRTDDTHMYWHKGGASDDNKWSITSAGNYQIKADVANLTISITKQ